jgi:hypothetical protein
MIFVSSSPCYNPPMNQILTKIIKNHNLGSTLLSHSTIQNLWSGYGKLLRVQTDKAQFIIKLIETPAKIEHPKGWSSEFAHKRKLKSYQVEMDFYAHYSSHKALAHTPNYIAHHYSDELQYLILEDLAPLGFIPKETVSRNQIEMCIKWLAHFHHTYLGTSPKKLWEVGTYWHLDTRPSEFEVMPEGDLKTYGKLVDEKLKSCPYKTLVHGDAKLANFMFSKDGVSAVDFQYIGGGVGVKDLAYFLSSIYTADELFKHEKNVLDLYFSHLESLGVDKVVINAWKELYPYAWFDFYRFLAGWSPRHYKINEYIKVQKEHVLKDLGL